MLHHRIPIGVDAKVFLTELIVAHDKFDWVPRRVHFRDQNPPTNNLLMGLLNYILWFLERF